MAKHETGHKSKSNGGSAGPLFHIPPSLVAPASEAKELLERRQYQNAVAFCQEQLAVLDRQVPARSNQPPQAAEPGSPFFQYYALTLLLADALAELKQWKRAKEVLGKYRVRFPRDPWGYEAGAEVTRRDPEVKDQAAVQRAIELLEGEAKRLRLIK